MWNYDYHVEKKQRAKRQGVFHAISKIKTLKTF